MASKSSSLFVFTDVKGSLDLENIPFNLSLFVQDTNEWIEVGVLYFREVKEGCFHIIGRLPDNDVLVGGYTPSLKRGTFSIY